MIYSSLLVFNISLLFVETYVYMLLWSLINNSNKQEWFLDTVREIENNERL